MITGKMASFSYALEVYWNRGNVYLENPNSCSLCAFPSQNHKMVEVGRNLCRSSDPTRLLKQDHLEHIAQDHVQVAFEYRQGWRLHNVSGQSMTGLGQTKSFS